MRTGRMRSTHNLNRSARRLMHTHAAALLRLQPRYMVSFLRFYAFSAASLPACLRYAFASTSYSVRDFCQPFSLRLALQKRMIFSMPFILSGIMRHARFFVDTYSFAAHSLKYFYITCVDFDFPQLRTILKRMTDRELYLSYHAAASSSMHRSRRLLTL